MENGTASKAPLTALIFPLHAWHRGQKTTTGDFVNPPICKDGLPISEDPHQTQFRAKQPQNKITTEQYVILKLTDRVGAGTNIFRLDPQTLTYLLDKVWLL